MTDEMTDAMQVQEIADRRGGVDCVSNYSLQGEEGFLGVTSMHQVRVEREKGGEIERESNW